MIHYILIYNIRANIIVTWS